MDNQQKLEKDNKGDDDFRMAKQLIRDRYEKHQHFFYKCIFPKGGKECGEMLRFPNMKNHIAKHWELYRLECSYCSRRFVDSMDYSMHAESTCKRANFQNVIRLPFDKTKEVDVHRSQSVFVKPLSVDQQRLARQRYETTKKKKARTNVTPCYDDDEDVVVPSSVGTYLLVGLEDSFVGAPPSAEVPRQAPATAPPEFAPNQPPPHPDMLHFGTPAQYWSAAQYQEFHRSQGTNGDRRGGPIRERDLNRQNRDRPVHGYHSSQQPPQLVQNPYDQYHQMNPWSLQDPRIANFQPSQHQQQLQQPPAPAHAFQQENPRAPGQNPLASIPPMPPTQTASSTPLEDPRLQRTKQDSAGPRDPRTATSSSAAQSFGLRDAPRAHGRAALAPSPDRRHSERERQSSPPAPSEPSSSTNRQYSEQTHDWFMSFPEPAEKVRKQYAPRRGSTSFSSTRSETMRAEPSTSASVSTRARTSHESSPAPRSTARGERRDRTPNGVSEEVSRGPASRTRSRTPIGHVEQSTSRENRSKTPVKVKPPSRARRSDAPVGSLEASSSRRPRSKTPIVVEPPSTNRARRSGTPIGNRAPSTSGARRADSRTRTSITPSDAPIISMPSASVRSRTPPSFDPASSNRAIRSVAQMGSGAPSTSSQRTRESTPNQSFRGPTTSTRQPSIERRGVINLKPQMPKARGSTPTSVAYKNRAKSPIGCYSSDEPRSNATSTTRGAPSVTSRNPFRLQEIVLQKKQTTQKEKDERRQALLSKMCKSMTGAQSSAPEEERRERPQNGERSERREQSESRSSRKRDTSSPDEHDISKRYEKRRK